MIRVVTGVVVIRTEANKWVSHKGKVRIIRERGTVKRIGILASKPRKGAISLTQPVGSVGRIIRESVDKVLWHVISVGKRALCQKVYS